MDRYLCVHGHFYQPPREHPWLETVEQQDDAYPFHDWNERITAECYATNVRARILDGDGRIVRLVNNYGRLSFNVGPTLLSWLRDAAPATYDGIIEADRLSADLFGGHGSAMAQAYNHAIMPLTSERDRRTQVVWGIKDFRYRFGRDPEGMWLPETAVDDATLDLLAEHGIAFTVLSPYQAARVRPIGETAWQDVGGGNVDPTMPYLVNLPSGRSIAVFFYDGPISQAVAFEGLLTSADQFEARLLEGFHDDRPGPQLVNIATDGESYGHHHRHGEMALAATLQRLLDRGDVQLTNYPEFLALHPPTHEAQVVQDSSWSCAHGVERWRADCGCSTGDDGRHQRWRGPLREALDWLRDELADRYERHGAQLLSDPWAARDDYVDVVLHRDDNLPGFLARHARQDTPSEADTHRILTLLELQRHALLMFTSCGWFFDELSRHEPLQVLRYAARAIQLAASITGRDDLEGPFLERLAKGESNEPRFGDGRGVYDQLVRPAVATLEDVAAHFAISGLSLSYGETERIGAYEVQRDDYHAHEAGRAKLAVGRLTVRSVVTWGSTQVEFGVLHLGDHNVVCAARKRGDDGAYARLREALERPFETADFPEVIRAIDEHAGGRPYSLGSLFRDEQQRILATVLETTLDEVEAGYHSIYRGRAPLMRFLAEIDAPIPMPLRNAAEVVLNVQLRRSLGSAQPDPDQVRSLLDEADRFDVELDHAGLAHTLSATIARVTERIADQLGDGETFITFDQRHEDALERVRTMLEVVAAVPFEADLTPAQDAAWRALWDHHVDLNDRAAGGDEVAARWLQALTSVAEAVGVVPPEPAEQPDRRRRGRAAATSASRGAAERS